jgi:membrane-associated phospholipid phosphatase
MSRLRSLIAFVAVILPLLGGATTASGADAMSGHIVMTLIPVAGLATAYIKDDDEGKRQWLRNVAVTEAVISLARLGFNETDWGQRPDGSSYGFPSGHIAFAGAGASFLQERYGWKYGVPAWLGTGYVAWARVDQRNHRWRDVAASAVVAYGIGKLFVTPEHATHLAPVIGPDFLGMRWQRSW